MSNYSETLQKKRAELKEVFDNPAEDGKYSAEQKNAINTLNTELSGLVDDANNAKAKAKNEKAMEQAVFAAEESDNSPKTIGESFVNSDAYKGYTEAGVRGLDSNVKFSPMGYKTTLGAGTSNNFPPEVLRQPGILESALRDPDAVIGLFDQIETDQNSFAYMEETTFTNASAEQA